jgi:hypothetical protein
MAITVELLYVEFEFQACKEDPEHLIRHPCQ